MAAPAVRYTYWLWPEERRSIVEMLQQRGTRVRPAKSVMCYPLDPFVPVSYIPVETWSRVCVRQGMWYRSSPRFGQELLVCSFPLDSLAGRLNTVIRPSSFRPRRYATSEEVESLRRSSRYLEQRPEGWEEVSAEERRRWDRWLRRRGLHMDADGLLAIHCANHANFLDPVLYIQRNGMKVPYSIAPSAQLCSCCLELYNLIGQEHPVKLVSPCLGALFFADLPPDIYFEVMGTESQEVDFQHGE